MLALSNESDPRLVVDVIVRLSTWFVWFKPEAEKSVLELGVGVWEEPSTETEYVQFALPARDMALPDDHEK